MAKTKNGTRYPGELRTRAVRMVLDHESEYASRSAAILSISQKVGCSRDSLRIHLIDGHTGTLGAAAVAASTVMTARHAAAQSAPKTGELKGKTAFVTGGARGIGLASAEEFAGAGANIVLFDIATPNIPHVSYTLPSQADLAAAQARIEALGAQCMIHRGAVVTWRTSKLLCSRSWTALAASTSCSKMQA